MKTNRTVGRQAVPIFAKVKTFKISYIQPKTEQTTKYAEISK